MNTAYRKVWRDLMSHMARTVLVVLSIAVGVMAVGMIFTSNTLMEQQMTRAQVASRPTNVWMFLIGRVDDAAIESVERMPEVDYATGRAERGVSWKASLGGEWEDASIVAIEDFREQSHDLLQLRQGDWPSSGGGDDLLRGQRARPPL